MRTLLVLGLVTLAASNVHAEVEVRATGDRVSLRVVSAPVSEVLESLARQTGMKVIYEAPPPRQALTTTLENRAPADVVLSLLEGLGVNYALVMDDSGARVEQLLLLGTLSATAPATSASTPAGGRAQATVGYRPTPEQEQAAQEDEDEDVDPPHQTLTPEEQDTSDRLTGKMAPAGAQAGPRPPGYPSSSFSPRLPVPISVPPGPQPEEDSPKR